MSKTTKALEKDFMESSQPIINVTANALPELITA